MIFEWGREARAPYVFLSKCLISQEKHHCVIWFLLAFLWKYMALAVLYQIPRRQEMNLEEGGFFLAKAAKGPSISWWWHLADGQVVGHLFTFFSGHQYPYWAIIPPTWRKAFKLRKKCTLRRPRPRDTCCLPRQCAFQNKLDFWQRRWDVSSESLRKFCKHINQKRAVTNSLCKILSEKSRDCIAKSDEQFIFTNLVTNNSLSQAFYWLELARDGYSSQDL